MSRFTGAKSVSTSTPPPAVRKVVSRMFVSGRYRRETSYSSRGAIRKKPPLPQSRMRAKTGRASKRWKQHQSIEPSRDTSAAVWQSESSA